MLWILSLYSTENVFCEDDIKEETNKIIFLLHNLLCLLFAYVSVNVFLGLAQLCHCRPRHGMALILYNRPTVHAQWPIILKCSQYRPKCNRWWSNLKLF
jgi:hypothetical protein